MERSVCAIKKKSDHYNFVDTFIALDRFISGGVLICAVKSTTSQWLCLLLRPFELATQLNRWVKQAGSLLGPTGACGGEMHTFIRQFIRHCQSSPPRHRRGLEMDCKLQAILCSCSHQTENLELSIVCYSQTRYKILS